MSILESAGISKEQLDAATGETAGEFQVLKAGVYGATVKEVLIYVNNFGDKTMQYTVNVTSEDRDVTFTKDVSATLKDGKPNEGYASRFKQFLYATNTSDEDCSIKENATKIKSFGKEYDCDEVIGMKGKKVLAMVSLRKDTNKADGAPYQMQNALNGVLAIDKTDASGDDKATAYNEKCEKNPITEYAGYVKASGATQAKANPNAAAEAEAEDF